MKQKSSTFTIPVRIYYEDTDVGGVVYYANYLRFLERCRTEWLREIGCHQTELLRDTGIVFVVRSVNVDYLKPARLDDLLTVSLEVEKITRSQIFFHQSVYRMNLDTPDGMEELLSGKVQIVSVNMEKMKISSIPAALRAQLESIQ